LYWLSRPAIDAITAVSPEGLIRVARLIPTAKVQEYIPLLCDFPVDETVTIQPHLCSQGLNLVYVGAHTDGRELETVLRGIVGAVRSGSKITAYFVGGTKAEIARLIEGSDSAELVSRSTIVFIERLARSEIPKMLSQMDVGLSIIPPKDVYYEASPTKIAEYFGAGLAVIASYGIPMQEKFVEDSRGGILIQWGEESITRAILALSEHHEKVDCMKTCAKAYAVNHLQYKNYLDKFMRLVDR